MAGYQIETIPLETGLSSAEAARRLAEHGHNEIPGGEGRGIAQILLGALREPMLLLLACCAALYFVMGEPKDGAILVFSVFVVLGITLYQEWKSERAVEALRDLSSPRALVIRDGREQRIAGRDVVPGDWVIIGEGDRVPADSVLVSSRHIKLDESLLTGESVAVTKVPVSGQAGTGVEAPEESRIYSGTLAVAGRGIARVVATGSSTQMGKIGRSLSEKRADASDRTLLQRELSKLTRLFAVIGIGFSSLIAIVYGLSRGDWPHALLVGLASAMSLLPEEFPVVLTVFLAMGAWRISKVQVLTRRISATESLGSITVLCVDKTGTLTRNEMELRRLVTVEGSHIVKDGADQVMSDDIELLLLHAALSSHPDPFDPMEKAIHRLRTPGAGFELLREYPLSHDLMAMTCVWRRRDAAKLVVATKGAPEAVLDLCRSRPEMRASILEQVGELASAGLRVLAVASCEREPGPLPESSREFTHAYMGLIAFEDPVRPEVHAAMLECKSAGIRVIMMTGDHAVTAQSIARQIGLGGAESIVTGAELAALDDAALRSRLRTTSVFARMVPEQKLRVIRALKSDGEIVAMTGDGVNDAPSLKWADVGIAMGRRGTDVAREASSIVLLDDNFASIVAAIRMGRRIYDNIRKAIAYILSVHVPIAGMAMFPVVLGLPLALLPAHIVFLELVIDPASALIFEVEAAEDNVMKRPPRRLDQRLFGLSEIVGNSIHGLIALVFVFATYLLTLRGGQDERMARTAAFLALVLSNLGLILVNRSLSSGFRSMLHVTNRAFVWLVAGTLAMLALILALPTTREVFRFVVPDARASILAVSAGVLTVLAVGVWRDFSVRSRAN